jgi:hypothetical protein
LPTRLNSLNILNILKPPRATKLFPSIKFAQKPEQPKHPQHPQQLPRATSCPVKKFGQKLEQPRVTFCPLRNFGKRLNSLNIPQIIPWKNVLPLLLFRLVRTLCTSLNGLNNLNRRKLPHASLLAMGFVEKVWAKA